ncbi:MAG: leucine-rich repeat domain-containing protein, partial [Ruminococcaceae bacterium]|nr:leucine-rich repeat domain-containing protein [Oscillospiraceae bacterium]
MDYIFRLITKAVTTAAKLSIVLDTYKAPPRPAVKPQNANAQQPISRTAPTTQAAPAASTPPPVKAPEPKPESTSVPKKLYRWEFEGAAPIAPGDIYIPDEYRSQRNEIRVIELTCESARALGYSFHKKTKAVRITGCHGTDTEIILPSKIGGLPVNEIGRRAFANSDIESVEIPDSVRKIGAEAFFESGVKRVIFGEGVRDIPERAFYKCAKLRTAALPTALRSIGREAFFACAELSYISLPYSLTSIGEKCFAQSDLRGFAAGFYSNFPHDGTAFEDTPLHRNFKVVLAKQNSTRMNVI